MSSPDVTDGCVRLKLARDRSASGMVARPMKNNDVKMAQLFNLICRKFRKTSKHFMEWDFKTQLS